jgi:GAF domain-containing protein
MPPEKNVDEVKRLEILKGMDILDTDPESRFDLITKKATQLLGAPIAVISIIDKDREWFKSCQGLEQKEGKRKVSFCTHALKADNLFVVEDTLKDERFKDNPYVTGEPFLRFYAGMVLKELKTGTPIGVFCIKDKKPRKMSPEEVAILIDLANQAEDELNKKIDTK